MILQELIPFLVQLAERRDIDIALVSINPADFAAAQVFFSFFMIFYFFSSQIADEIFFIQSIRARYWKTHERATGMSSKMKNDVEQLAKYAKNDQLALFIGAGVSVGAGLPTWGQLLNALGKKGGMSQPDIDILAKMNFLDQVFFSYRFFTTQ